jgi:hypothetical protein
MIIRYLEKIFNINKGKLRNYLRIINLCRLNDSIIDEYKLESILNKFLL